MEFESVAKRRGPGRPRGSTLPAADFLPEDESSLFYIIRNGKISLQSIVDDWIDSYKSDRDSALLALMQFFISASGCRGRITSEMQVKCRKKVLKVHQKTCSFYV